MVRQLRELFPYLVFPGIIGGGLGTTLMLMQQDVRPEIAALVAVLIFGFVLIPVLERLMPYQRHWNDPDQDIATDGIHMLINVLIPKLWTPTQAALLVGVTAWATQRFGSQLWPAQWHWLPELFLMLVIAEFGRYWLHRAAHRVPFLWRFHAVHHSPNRLYFLNANRFHPIEKCLLQIAEVAPFIVLGTPPDIIALYFTFNALHGFMQHGNIQMKLGCLNYLFSMAELHRWHHSQRIEESDSNYGNNLIVWDLLFGTYFLPKDREVGTLGLLSADYPKSYLAQLQAPFAPSDLSRPADLVEPGMVTSQEGK